MHMDPVKGLVRGMLLYRLFHLSFSLDVITPQYSLRDGEVVISRGNTFALGFFSPGNSRYRYVGIWFYQVPQKTVVWVANRENPINDTSGTLSISSQGNLVLYHENQTILVWSTNSSVSHPKNPTARLLDSGNLVLAQNDAPYWQSFDDPTNAGLPSRKLGLNLTTGLNRILTSWKSPDDPGIGNFTYMIDPTGFPQLLLYKGSVKFWRGGSWTGGRRWVGVPEMIRNRFFNINFTYSDEEVSEMVEVKNSSVISILIANETGLVQRFIWSGQEQRWITYWSAPKEECDYYGHCGPNKRDGGTGCLTWYGDLMDIKTYSDAGQDLYVRVDAVHLAKYRKNGKVSKKQMAAILVVSVAAMLSIFAFAYYLARRIRRGNQISVVSFYVEKMEYKWQAYIDCIYVLMLISNQFHTLEILVSLPQILTQILILIRGEEKDCCRTFLFRLLNFRTRSFHSSLINQEEQEDLHIASQQVQCDSRPL
ncbi:hypothetical protein V6N11_047171 [Hibiscus sabdariffa]|uniref:Bulb-type lectin domain-containing protein n=1 Tax=Hibiscus sabdariffa TaxID=183260 RepID=A0ABR2A5Y3_9ROSI